MSGKRILLVDDDVSLQGALMDVLRDAGHSVVASPNGREALKVFLLDDFDLVLTDIQMPEMNGLQLLAAIRRVKPAPVVLMTAFSELCEAQEAIDLGAAGFLAKPFRREELLELIDRTTGPAKPLPPEDDDAEFSRLCIEDFISGREVRYEVFIRLSERKYLKIAHMGEDVPVERIMSYKMKGVRHLYLKKADFRRYLGFSATLVQAAVGSKAIPREKKVGLLKHTGEIIGQELSRDSVDPELYDITKNFLENTVSVLSDDLEVFNLLSLLSSRGDPIYGHCVVVSMVAVLIARKLGWTSSPNLFKIAMSGLFHDVGMKELEPDLLSAPRYSMNPDQVKSYETHPTKGLDILSRIKSIPSDVVQVAFQHHENCHGQGYPRGVTKAHIHPFARLIAVADEFCYLTMRSAEPERMNPLQAIQRMQAVSSTRFDSQYLGGLFSLFMPAARA